jgi:hypothetical protein
VEAIAATSADANSGVATAAYTINLLTDFSVAASSVSLTMTAGQSATASISVTPLNGFNSAVSFNCSGLPSGASCSFAPATVTPLGTPASTMLTVTTAAATAAFRRNSNPLFPGSVLVAALSCFGLRRRRHLRILLLLALSVVGLSLLNGCGGGSFSTPQLVTSTVTVTATAGPLQHATTILLTVN